MPPSAAEPRPGWFIVGAARRKRGEAGFSTLEIVASLREASGEPWSGPRSEALIILRVEQIRASPADASRAASAPLPVRVAQDGFALLGFSAPLTRLRSASWTRILSAWPKGQADEARSALARSGAPAVLARVHGLNSGAWDAAWTWDAEGRLCFE